MTGAGAWHVHGSSSLAESVAPPGLCKQGKEGILGSSSLDMLRASRLEPSDLAYELHLIGVAGPKGGMPLIRRPAVSKPIYDAKLPLDG